MRVRRAALAACLAVAASIDAAAQSGGVTGRRLTTIEAIRQFPGYYHLQNVLVRGEFQGEGTSMMLGADGAALRVVLNDGVRAGAGIVEARGQLIDVGRLEPGDPRLPPGSEIREGERWPRPGEELFLRVTAVMEAQPVLGLTVRALAIEPWRYEGQKVTVVGNFRGRNLFGDLAGSPGSGRYDFVIRGAEGAVWVTGQRPRGRGFDLDVDRRVDTDKWLEVSGTLVYERGLVRIEATRLALSTPPAATTETAEEADAPSPPPPPLQVVFSTPTEGETDVGAAAAVRVQFSRGIDPKSLPGAIRASYVGGEGVPPAFLTTYDAGNRALTLRFTDALERFRTIRIDVLETLKAFDGAPTAPWSLTFTVGE